MRRILLVRVSTELNIRPLISDIRDIIGAYLKLYQDITDHIPVAFQACHDHDGVTNKVTNIAYVRDRIRDTIVPMLHVYDFGHDSHHVSGLSPWLSRTVTGNATGTKKLL